MREVKFDRAPAKKMTSAYLAISVNHFHSRKSKKIFSPSHPVE